MSFKNQFAKVEDDLDAERSLMCQAHECPNRWSVGMSNLCSAHAWADPARWHEITNDQLRLFAAHQNAPKRQTRPVDTLTYAQKKKVLEGLISTTKSQWQEGKDWAHKLKQRENDGEKLSQIQRKFWREALHEH
jgi:hypothetical protein